MTTSTRFAAAVHILTGLVLADGAPLPSERIARSVNTNPAVVRRILMSLAAADLTTSQLGVGGGALLAKSPDQITLLEVFEAVENTELVAVHRSPPDPNCQVGAHILPAFCRATSRAEEAFRAELAKISLADIVAEVVAAGQSEATGASS